MSQAEDLEAINQYFARTAAKNAQAKSLKDNWTSWFKGLSFWAKSMNGDTLDEANKRRFNFNAANGTPETVVTIDPAEKAKWDAYPTVNVTGMTPEQAAQAAWTPKSTGGSTTAALTPGARPTIRQGDGMGNRTAANLVAAVKEWQTILGVTPDGKFGGGTRTATIAKQKALGLTGKDVDGVVGPKTWNLALAAAAPKGIIESVKETVFGPVPAAPSVTPRPAAPRPAAPRAPAAAARISAPVAARQPGPAVRTGTTVKVPPTGTTAQVAAGISAANASIPGWVKWSGAGLLVAALGALGLAVRSTVKDSK